MKEWVSDKNQILAGADESNPTLWKLANPHYRTRYQPFQHALLSQDVHQPRRLQLSAKSVAFALKCADCVAETLGAMSNRGM
ncbi:MAG: hypothetical protein ACW99U_06670 [Candidatus Thorarchaeota archaeon]|jgi:hypothetical protein